MHGAAHAEMGSHTHAILREPEWVSPLATYRIDLAAKFDGWLQALDFAVVERLAGVTIGGYSYDMTSEDKHFQVFLDGPEEPLSAVLMLDMRGEEVIVSLAGTEHRDVTDLHFSLTDALARAASILGGGEIHDWVAFIGHPAERWDSWEKRLVEPFTVGPLQVASTDVTYVEIDTSGSPSFGSYGWRASVPFAVRGRTSGEPSPASWPDTWPYASVQVSRDLRTLCGLLSIAWDSPFIVRDAARPSQLDSLYFEHPPWMVPPIELFGEEWPRKLPGDPVQAPEWINRAWDALRDDPHLLGALDVYLEGLYMERRHPSMATVAMTACIESIATKVYRTKRCSQCNAHTGIARSFRAALRLVLPEEEAKQLDPVYGQRSGTVHSGRLHADEAWPGALLVGFDDPSDDPTRFRFAVLFRMREAARGLLLLALRGSLPAASDLN